MLFHIYVRIYKPDSVIDNHLSCRAVASTIFAVQTILLWSTTLHSGKNFAVSPLPSDRIIPKGTLRLSPRASLLASLVLPQAGVTRYLAPTIKWGMSGLSSLRRLADERSSDTNMLILQTNLTLSNECARLPA